MDIAFLRQLLKQSEYEKEKVPFQRRLYRVLKEGILNGRLHANLKLPSSRTMAAELGISRNSVLFAYEQLILEGFLQATRQGTLIAEVLGNIVNTALPQEASPGLSTRGLSVPMHWRTQSDIIKPFTPGIPDIAKFPLSQWRTLIERTYREINPRRLTFGEIGGEPELRQALSAHLSASRGLRCKPEQIIITHSAQGALDLCARMLADPGQTAWIEDPGYFGARVAMQTAGLSLHGIPVDEHGANPTEADWHGHPPRLVYLTPAHQYPMGSVLSVTRRLDMIKRAAELDCWIVEDDYDSEFRYQAEPIPALQGLVQNASVIYVGTFSKTFLPVLRMGYLVVPTDIQFAISNIAAQFSRPGHVIEQLALAQFLATGRYTQHLKKMRNLYDEKRYILRESIDRHLREEVEITGGAAGMHLTAVFKRPVDDRALHDLAKREGLIIPPLSRYYLRPRSTNMKSGMLLGYGTIAASVIDPAVRQLKKLVTAL